LKEYIKIIKFRNYFIPCLGGIVGGLSVSNNFWILTMPLSLSILWNGFDNKRSNFVWGFFFILVSHYWLIYLHPLTWLGYSWLESLIISSFLLLICSALGGILIVLWGLSGKKFFSKKYLFSYTNYQIFLKVLFLSCTWALGELILKQTPFFWIGLGESLIPGDLYLAGLARLFGSSGLCVVQLLIGFWMFFIFERWNRKYQIKELLLFGVVLILCLHFLGAFLISQKERNVGYPIALWQTNIPTREKIFVDNQKMFKKLISAQRKAISEDAKLLITPEGTLNRDFVMEIPSLLDTLTGGFRISGNDLRSSLFLLKKGDKTYTKFIDKNRLVPLGEKLPKLLNNFSGGLSSLGGLHSGEPSRYFDGGKTPPLAVAICYEISDGIKIKNAINKGSELILSIANLDPYPLKIQKQFLSLARLRSIENNRDNLIISNTGPSGLIGNDGRIYNLLESSKEEIKVFYPLFNRQNTFYNKFGEKPFLFLLILLFQQNFKMLKRSTN
tara:strand:- start:4888 stop:6387 length:1500 start_codon:yes stop_codon:yes gene_type:complete